MSHANPYRARNGPSGGGLLASLAQMPQEVWAALTVVALLALGMLSLPADMRRRLAAEWVEQATRLSQSATRRLERQRKRRLYLPGHFWRYVAAVIIIALLGADPHLDFWSLRAQCSYPPNTSTPTTRITQFAYDFDGHLTQMNAPEGVINYTYDLPTGRLTGTCTTNSEVDYTYDQLGRLSTVHVVKRNGAAVDETTTYTYDKVGNRSKVTLPTGVVTTCVYDSLNRLTSLTHQLGTTNLATYSYKLSASGRRTNAVEILLQESGEGYLTNTLTWNFDQMYRLTNEVSISSATNGSGTFTNAYQYDQAGNRFTKVHYQNGTTTTITNLFDANDQLLREVTLSGGTTTDTNSYGFDLNGSLIGKTNASGTITYTYNLANKLSAVTTGGATTGYDYSDQGIRVRSYTTGSTNYYLVDANNHTGYQQVLEELASPGGAPSLSYVIGDDVLAQCGAAGATPSYFLPDGHGSNRQLFSAGSGVASHYNYDAYGETLSDSSSGSATTKLYCGEQFDSTLNMYNLRARYYDPSAGRFNQRDTLAASPDDPQSLHRYLYVNCDPLTAIDPSGQQGVLEVLIVVAVVAVLVGLTGCSAKPKQDAKDAEILQTQAYKELITTKWGQKDWKAFQDLRDSLPDNQKWQIVLTDNTYPHCEIGPDVKKLVMPRGGMPAGIQLPWQKELPSKLLGGVVLAHEIGHILQDSKFSFNPTYQQQYADYMPGGSKAWVLLPSDKGQTRLQTLRSMR